MKRPRKGANALTLQYARPQAYEALFNGVETRSRLPTDIHPRMLPILPVSLRAAAYTDYFIRPLDAGRSSPGVTPQEQLQDLLSYRFDLRPAPPSSASAAYAPNRSTERGGSSNRVRVAPLRLPCPHGVSFNVAPAGKTSRSTTRWWSSVHGRSAIGCVWIINRHPSSIRCG